MILDAWSRRVVGYAISRSIDARLAVAALKAAIRGRKPPTGCLHHSDRGSQYASEIYRQLLPHCTSLYLTLLPFEAEGDTVFPEFADQFPHYEILESTPEAEWRRYTRDG